MALEKNFGYCQSCHARLVHTKGQIRPAPPDTPKPIGAMLKEEFCDDDSEYLMRLAYARLTEAMDDLRKDVNHKWMNGDGSGYMAKLALERLQPVVDALERAL